ncbi:ABC transporter permease [Bacillus suaedaesalsae]|uniref:ABC transporter permease subunit n=1 Tax=Bacillus suaedaesalsae TaxID=2810349 RepID=A0ABS2DEA3_9BACI|nr:ABC transporter permease subunit [Bacillus suaedaesalsae]MBM6616792.1 ABC transporter permease subunit [Bacillus suaedaesalsae]
MIKKLFTQPMFLIGFVIIAGLLISSFVYTAVYDDVVPQDRYIYDENGSVVDSAPLPPSKDAWFGTDMFGFHMLHKMIIGAKFTILAALSIALLRVIVAIPIGIFFSSYLTKFRKYLNGFIDSFHYIPLTLIAYYILYPVLWMGPEGFHYSFFERISIEVVVLTVLAVPILAVLISNESAEVMKKDFVISSQTLGASKFFMIRKHILPLLKEKFVIMFGQQVVQVLLLLSHLGLMKLFFGGTVVSFDPMMGDPPTTLSMEWSGLIGDAQRFMKTSIWIPFTPILFFAISIYAVNLMTEGFTKISMGESKRRKKRKSEEAIQEKIQINNQSFELKHKTTSQSKAV